MRSITSEVMKSLDGGYLGRQESKQESKKPPHFAGAFFEGHFQSVTDKGRRQDIALWRSS